MRTATSIIASFTERTMAGEVIAPEEWLLASQMLTVLLKEETDKMFELQVFVNKLKVDKMENGATAAKARIYAEATNSFTDFLKQGAFVNQIWEFIRVAKKQAELANK